MSRRFQDDALQSGSVQFVIYTEDSGHKQRYLGRGKARFNLLPPMKVLTMGNRSVKVIVSDGEADVKPGKLVGAKWAGPGAKQILFACNMQVLSRRLSS